MPQTPHSCDFCGMCPSEVTVRRTREGQQIVLRLCGRCAALQQYVLHVALLESKIGGNACFTCGAPARGYAVVKDALGHFMGRYAVCQSCPERPDMHANQLLERATPWTPGVLELPPPPQRAIFAALKGPPAPRPDPGGRPPVPGGSPPAASGRSPAPGGHPPAATARPPASGPPPAPSPAPSPAAPETPRTPREQEIEALQEAMEEAVRVEDYERAAALRDRVRRLKE